MLPAHDRAYARYLVVRLATAAAGYASPFYAVYARRSLAAPPEMVGIYLMGFTLSGVLSNLVSGKIGDRYGNRRLMRLAAATAVLSPALALLVAHLPEEAVPKASLVFALVFAFRGLHVTASSIGGSNYVLELASSEERPTYVGFANGLTGLALFLSPLGGAVVDRLGFTPLFLLSLTCGLVAVLFSLGLREPREGRVTVS
jgi:MFS family permease